MSERTLVTGAFGFIGSWVIRQLLDEGAGVVALDAGPHDHRLRYLLTDSELSRIARVAVDVVDVDALRAVVSSHEVSRIVHLAALQVPLCAADPPLGARVNVVGLVNVLQVAAERRLESPVVYASSIAALDSEGGSGIPKTLYGVFKRANEGSADVFHRDHGVCSIGLRPYVAYGVGRDQGLTSAPTRAMLRAAAGFGDHIPFGGRSHMQYAGDVAAAFVAASRSSYDGAGVFNLGGSVVTMAEVVGAIEAAVPERRGSVTFDDTPLPFPPEVDSSELEAALGTLPVTPLNDGVRETIERFVELIRLGRISVPAA